MTSPTPDTEAVLEHLIASKDGDRKDRFLAGLALPFRAVKFLAKKPKLWPWAVLPALINAVVFVITAAALVFNAGRMLEWLWARPEVVAWYHWVFVAIWYVFFALLLAVSLVIAYYVVLLVGGAIASPFNDKLSRETERMIRGSVADARPDEMYAIGVIRSATISILRTVLYLGSLGVLFLLNLIPALGNAAFTVSASCLSAVFLAIEYSDDTLDRHGRTFEQKLRTIRRHIEPAGGFGAGTSVLLIVPVLNLLAMPIAVVGGTILGLAIESWEEERADD